MVKQLVCGEFYRAFREQRNRRNAVLLLLAAAGCFALLAFYENVKKEVPDMGLMNLPGVAFQADTYNLGFAKIWNTHALALSSAGSVFDAILPSGNLALLVGLFSGMYAVDYRRQTSYYLRARRYAAWQIIAAFLTVEVVMANAWVLLYEIVLLAMCGAACIFTPMRFLFSGGVFWWAMCVHINCTAFALLTAALAVVAQKAAAVAAACVSLVLAGGGCLELVIVLFRLPVCVGKIWVLNNLMNTSVETVNLHGVVEIVCAAGITCLLAAGVIALEFHVNQRERYR